MEQAADPTLFHALIVPHRSLTRRGLTVLLLVIALACTINASVFIAIGAWPVAGFTGAELLLAGVLFRINVLAARGSELVVLTPSRLRIVRTAASGLRRQVDLAPGWLGVDLQERPGRAPALLLTAHGVREEIGTALGETERRELAASLSEALRLWRNPVFNNPQLRP